MYICYTLLQDLFVEDEIDTALQYIDDLEENLYHMQHRQFSRIVGYRRAPREVEVTMKAVLLLLGTRKKELLVSETRRSTNYRFVFFLPHYTMS